MEIKKSPKADLEKKKGLFLEIGLIVTLLVVIFAFEWQTEEKEEMAFATETAVEIEATNTHSPLTSPLVLPDHAFGLAEKLQ